MAYQYPQPPNNPSYQPQNSNPYGAPGWNAPPNAETGSVPQYHNEPNYAEGGIPKSDINFTNVSIRAAFIRKVFFMVSVMLGVVSIMTAIPFLHQPTFKYVRQNPALYYVSYGAFLVVYIVLMCCENVRRSFPANIICTGILTLSIGYMTMMISAFYTIESVLMTLIITSAVCGAIIIFSMQTKYDITSMMGWMFIASMVLFFFGIVAIIGTIAFKVRILYTIYAGCAALFFMVYLAIDIQMIMGGRKYEISPEDHIFAAIQIFLDIVYIFWMLLSLLGNHN